MTFHSCGGWLELSEVERGLLHGAGPLPAETGEVGVARAGALPHVVQGLHALEGRGEPRHQLRGVVHVPVLLRGGGAVVERYSGRKKDGWMAKGTCTAHL
jgi:hypothetical protein